METRFNFFVQSQLLVFGRVSNSSYVKKLCMCFDSIL